MNALVVNLTRFGDLLQTQPVLAGLCGAGFAPGLACLDNFQGAAGLLAGVAHMAPLPGSRFLAALDGSWPEGVRLAKRWVEELRERFAPDLVVNLTPSLPARLLASRLGAAECRGFLVDGFGFNADSGPWAAFLLIASARRGLSPFNVVDVFCRASGLDPAGGEFHLARPSDGAMDAAGALLARSGLARGAGYFCVQLGASEDRRRWPVERFAAFSRELREAAGLAPVLVGTKSEARLGERFVGLCPGAVNLIGATNLEELAAVVAGAGLMATGDTGTMHLAAGLGVPVASIFLATAQPWDTGPYLPGALSLEPDMACHPCAFGEQCPRNHACREAVPHSTMLDAALAFLDTGTWPRGTYPGARAWEAAPDEAGFMDLASLSGHEGEDRTVFARIQRHFYRHFLDNAPPPPFDAPVEALAPETRAATGKAVAEALQLSGLLAEQGRLLTLAPRPALKTKFLAFWQRMENVLTDCEALHTLGRLWTFQANSPGMDADGLASMAQRYHDLLAAMAPLFPLPR